MRKTAYLLVISVLGTTFAGTVLADAQTGADNDQDGDGVPDEVDLCPKVADANTGVYADGCPATDADHDGIPDYYDLCPNEVETGNGFKDQDGCPDAAAAELSAIGQKVYFETAKATLDASGKGAANEVGAFLRAHAEIVHVNVVGYADSRGSAGNNATRSLRWAEAMHAAMTARGVVASRPAVRGDGAQPAEAPEILAANRRAGFVVTDLGLTPVKIALSAGKHPFILTKGDVIKSISVAITSGQTAKQHVDMAEPAGRDDELSRIRRP